MTKDSTEKLPSIIRDKCGTSAGYQHHLKYGEVTCPACRKASSDRVRANYVLNREKIIKRNKEIYGANPERMKEYRRKYYYAHQEFRIESTRKYQLAHPEETKKFFQEHAKRPEVISRRKITSAITREKNREQIRANSRKSSANNPDTSRRKSSRRRAKIRSGKFEKYTEAQVIKLYGTDCYLCHLPIDMTADRRCGKPGWDKSFWIEHVIPIVLGGGDILDNVRPSHGKCNLDKGKLILG